MLMQRRRTGSDLLFQLDFFYLFPCRQVKADRPRSGNQEELPVPQRPRQSSTDGHSLLTFGQAAAAHLVDQDVVGIIFAVDQAHVILAQIGEGDVVLIISLRDRNDRVPRSMPERVTDSRSSVRPDWPVSRTV